MPRLTQINLWGRAGTSLDPQRADLWQIDLDTAMNGLRQRLQNLSQPRAAQLLSAFPTNDNVPLFARRVDFPKVNISNQPVRRDNAYFIAPSYDNTTTPLTITFIHEIADQSFNYSGSTIWAVMEAWQAFARAGQQLTTASNELSLGLTAAADPGTLRVKFQYPIRVNMLASYQSTTAVSSAISPTSSPTSSLTPGISNAVTNQNLLDGSNLTVVATYQAINAWPSEVALGTVSQTETGQLLEIQVTFTCDSFSSL